MSRTTTPDSFVENQAATGETGSEKQERTENPSVPRPHIVQNILSYSKALKVKKSANLGQVENLMN